MLEDIGEYFANNVSELYYAFVGTADMWKCALKPKG